MAIQDQVVQKVRIYRHMETTNQSFIDMHYYLKQKGIKNNDFFLILYDRSLAGVDPRDPNLTREQKIRILNECKLNYWYYLREVLRIPVQGSAVKGGVRYRLHRGNLAMNFLFVLNYNMFVELPRQHGKTIGALARYLWVFNFGSTNSEIMFIHKDHSGSKNNLKNLKNLREALPSYLQMDSATLSDGRKLKVPNTIETMGHPLNGNKITTFASARNKEYADNLGRGCTMPIQYYDEFAFMPYNKIVYSAAVPAFSTASENAKRNNAPYGILITTTPGDLTTEQGQYAFEVRNNATPWNEAYYDRSYDQLEELRQSNTRSSFFLISYTYQQLGSGEDYFKKMVVELQNDWPAIRREIMLEWSKVSSNCPFRTEDLDIIRQYVHEPIRTILFGRAQQYQFLVYEDIDLRYPPIVGVDVSGAMYQDSSAITVVDSRTTRVCATLNCNFIPSDDLADVVYTLVSNYMPNAIINVERNGGFGTSVVQRLVKTSVKKNLYWEIKDKPVEESFNGVRTVKKMAKVKVYGTDSTKDVRARLIEILYERVAMHKDKFVAPILLQEMEAMEVKKSGKVEHSDQSHDDQVFSYLMALRVWYDGIDLMEKFGIQKTTIKTDTEEEIKENELEATVGGLEEFDIETASKEPEDEGIESELAQQLDYIKDASKSMLAEDFYKQQSAMDEASMNMLLQTKVGKEAYVKAYNIDLTEPAIGGNKLSQSQGYTSLPDDLFGVTNDDMLFDDDEIPPDNVVGNLSGWWRQLG